MWQSRWNWWPLPRFGSLFNVLNIDRHHLPSLIIARQTMSVDGQTGQLD